MVASPETQALVIIAAVLLIIWLVRTSLVEKEVKERSELDKALVDLVVKYLKTESDCFSANWYGENLSMDKSVMHKNRKVQIMIETGQILTPFEPQMTKAEMQEIMILIKPIVKRDMEKLIQNLP